MGLLLFVNDPGLEPAGEGVIRIDSIVDLNGFSTLPLLQESVGVNADVLIEPIGPPREMDIDLLPLHIDYFSIDPFVFTVQNIQVLT